MCLRLLDLGSGSCSHVVHAFDAGNKKAIDQGSTAFDCLDLVPRRGLEPPRLSALVPETSASTNSAIWASQEALNYRARKSAYGPSLEKSMQFLNLENLGNKKADDLWSSAFLISYLYKIGAQKRTRTSTPLSAST